MGSDDWYRNTHWTAEAEATFNRKIDRARGQKAQYLRIQGSVLRQTDPHAAIGLLRRAIAERDESTLAHAYLDLAHAHHALGDVDAALDALEAAIEQQERHPMFRTSAAYDFAFLVALNGRSSRYDKALSLLEHAGDGFFASMVFEAAAAKALIFSARHEYERARQAAQVALSAQEVRVGWIPGYPAVGVVPAVDTPLARQLQDIAELSGSS